MTELHRRSAVELAAIMRSGEVSAREVLDDHLARVEAVNPQLNAIVTLAPELAYERAQAADQAVVNGEALGPLHGLPIAHKDLELTAGIRTTFGSPVFVDQVPDEDGLVASRYKAAGAIVFGKTNTPEFGAGSNTFNTVFGQTKNPYDHDRTCGGSSGGAAVALADHMMPIADGSDMGGSLRNPASFCNVVGLRPSYGRVPSWPNKAPWSGVPTSGAMARSVDDLALQLQAIAGPDSRVPISLGEPGSIFASIDNRDLDGVRVAWTPDLGLPIDVEVVDALAFVPGELEGLGCQVTEAMPDLHDAREIFQVLRAWHFEISAGAVVDSHPEQVKETVRWNVQAGRERTLQEHAAAVVAHGALIERVRAFFDEYDVLALPTTQVPPFDIDLEYPSTLAGAPMQTYIDWMRSCSDITVTGCPAISMPAAFTPDGLPIGVQFVGPPRGDVELLRFARSWESAVSPRRVTVVDR